MSVGLGPPRVRLDTPTVLDSTGQPVYRATITAYLKEHWDADTIAELGVTMTKADGTWQAPIYLDPWAAGLDIVLLIVRPGHLEPRTDGIRAWLPPWGPLEVTVTAPVLALLTEAGEIILTEAGEPILAEIAEGTYSASPLSLTTESGLPILTEAGAQLLWEP